ncbi:MAG: hypothetical protein KAZ05_02830 [Negativicutes bacterium]|jgi:hypothetical protein|nr:hypothetical protein [Negativicutes bacterium]
MNKPMNNKSTETSPKNMIETGDRFEEEVMYAAPGDLSYSFEERVQW